MKPVNPYKTALDEGNAFWMARLSLEVYKKVSKKNEKPAEKRILASLQKDDPNFMSVVGADKNSAQAALIEHNDYLCMAFRGTDELADWLDNINVFRKNILFGEFHRGFWESVEDVWDVVYSRFEDLQKERIKRKEKKRPLFFTGHSLGGAMATIAAARFLHEDWPFTSVYTFGQPRAMDRPTARTYKLESNGRHHRFQNNEDIVTRVPTRLAGYSHVGNCLYINTAKEIHGDPGWWYRFLDTVEGAANSLIKSGSVGAIKDHDMNRYLEAIEKWNYHP